MQNSHESRNSTKEDDCGDYRKNANTKVLSRSPTANISRTRTNTSLKIEKDKELINTGLHRLVSSFNTAHKLGQKSSKLVTSKKNETKLTRASVDAMPERQVNSHIQLGKRMSVDKHTMTDFEENERKLEMETTVLDDKPPYKDLQWTDPRLLKKYSLVKQQQYKKSLTIPYVNKSEYGSDMADDEESELLNSENKHFLFRCLYYFCTASVSFIGSMCGITLITVILWKLLDENLLNFQFEAPKNDLFMRRIVKAVAGLVFDVINNMLGKILRLLTISTSEVFAAEQEPAATAWYHKLY